MKQYFELGLCVAALIGILATLLQDWTILYTFSIVIGAGAVIVALLIFAIFKRRTEAPIQAAAQRKFYAGALLMFSLPNFVVAFLYVVLRAK